MLQDLGLNASQNLRDGKRAPFSRTAWTKSHSADTRNETEREWERRGWRREALEAEQQLQLQRQSSQ
jgi:hypothetical protein